MSAAVPAGLPSNLPSVVLDVRARLRDARAQLPPVSLRYREQLRELVLLGSASRGGSSLLAEVLRSSRQFVHLRGEINPLLVLNGHAFPSSGTGSDALGAEHAVASDDLDQDLAFECGRATSDLSDKTQLLRFAVDLASRLWMQWPSLHITLSEVDECMRAALSYLVNVAGWRPGRFENAAVFHAVFLRELRRFHPDVNPYCYDMSREILKQCHPDVEPALGPPSHFLIEEPPFITIGPWQPLSEGASVRPLLVKTPSNAYRFPYFQALFPNARVRMLHLTRNVAASVNGLYDGWLHNGFFARRVPTQLSISEYSERFPAWGRRWWKFDLPPGWSHWANARLQDVCLFQWLSAHRRLLEVAERPGQDYLRIKFEDVIRSRESRRHVLERVIRWSGGDLDIPLTEAVALPVVMATAPPGHRRWTQRAKLLEPIYGRADARATMRELGYEADPAEWD